MVYFVLFVCLSITAMNLATKKWHIGSAPEKGGDYGWVFEVYAKTSDDIFWYSFGVTENGAVKIAQNNVYNYDGRNRKSDYEYWESFKFLPGKPYDIPAPAEPAATEPENDTREFRGNGDIVEIINPIFQFPKEKPFFRIVSFRILNSANDYEFEEVGIGPELSFHYSFTQEKALEKL